MNLDRMRDGEIRLRAGMQIQFVAGRRGQLAVGARGIVALPVALDFGPEKETVRVTAETDFAQAFGMERDAPGLLLVREALKKARAVLVYRLNGGARAVAVLGNLTATARFGGSRGDRVAVQVVPDADLESQFVVTTLIDGAVADIQRAGKAQELGDNRYVVFSGTGDLSECAGNLEGGDDGSVLISDYADFFAAMENEAFQVMALPVEDSDVLEAGAAFVIRLREEEGCGCQLAAPRLDADHEGVISVQNGVRLEDGTELTAAQACAYVAGMTAGARLEQSNTGRVYEGAVEVNEAYTASELEQLLRQGRFVFVKKAGMVIAEQDINCLVNITPDKSRAFCRNRVVRVMDEIAAFVREVFTAHYLGQVDNNEDGRSLFAAELAARLCGLQEQGAIAAFSPHRDILVRQGDTPERIVAELCIAPVDSMEKLFMTVCVN